MAGNVRLITVSIHGHTLEVDKKSRALRYGRNNLHAYRLSRLHSKFLLWHRFFGPPMLSIGSSRHGSMDYLDANA